jgi:nucleoside-diphosphate-sugar epimerase
MDRALVLAGAGSLGPATAERLAAAGWGVTLGVQAHGQPAVATPGIAVVPLDSRRPDNLVEAIGAGVDALIDLTSRTAADAQRVLRLEGRLGAVIALSTASVYTDHHERVLGERFQHLLSFPELPVPVREDQPVVSPANQNYAARKIAMERLYLQASRVPVTILRPRAIQGPGVTKPIEWHFLKRMLDRRPVIIHAFRGENAFHTASLANVSQLIRLAAERPGTRVLNCADPDAPTPRDVTRAVATAVGVEATELLLPGPPPAPGVGDTPCTLPRPFVLDLTAVERELGYRPVTTYVESVAETCTWLRRITKDRDWRAALPQLAHDSGAFDYVAEDTALARLSGLTPQPSMQGSAV